MDFFYDKKVIPIRYLGEVAENLALDELEKRGFKILLRRPYFCLRCYAVLPKEVIKKQRELRREYYRSQGYDGSEENKKEEDREYFCHHWEGEAVSIPPCPISENYIELMKYVYNIAEHARRSSYYNTRTWDFSTKKDDKIFLIEVKANRSRLVGNQRKILLHAKKLGFIPLLIHIDGFEMKIRYNEIRFEKL
jgi:hypothetical protein